VRVRFTTVNVLTGRPVTGVRVQIAGLPDLDSGPNGTFVVETTTAGTLTATLSSSEIITRVTKLRVPGVEGEVSLMPRDFNMVGFDQMARRPNVGLVRWTSQPRLVIERRVLQYAESADFTYVATEQVMSDSVFSSLVADLSSGLADLTGNEYRGFSSVQQITSSEGARVSLVSSGDIKVAKVRGLTNARNAIGLGGASSTPAGAVTLGLMMLDEDYDGRGSYAVHVRVHELGHALGWQHVTEGQSVMHPTDTSFTTQFDRDAGRLAFKRMIGSKSPDVDQDAFTINLSGMGERITLMP
jgi:hypothetical protein